MTAPSCNFNKENTKRAVSARVTNSSVNSIFNSTSDTNLLCTSCFARLSITKSSLCVIAWFKYNASSLRIGIASFSLQPNMSCLTQSTSCFFTSSNSTVFVPTSFVSTSFVSSVKAEDFGAISNTVFTVTVGVVSNTVVTVGVVSNTVVIGETFTRLANNFLLIFNYPLVKSRKAYQALRISLENPQHTQTDLSFTTTPSEIEL